MPDPLVSTPASYVAGQSLFFGTNGGRATAVDRANPLPVATVTTGAASAPLAGSTSAGGVVGPFQPQLGRAIWLTLSGTWSGSVQLLRSSDGGATRLPLTYGDGTAKPVWTAGVNAAVADETVAGASYWLAITLASGAVSYRVEQ